MTISVSVHHSGVAKIVLKVRRPSSFTQAGWGMTIWGNMMALFISPTGKEKSYAMGQFIMLCCHLVLVKVLTQNLNSSSSILRNDTR